MARRGKTRVEHLAEAHAQLLKAQSSYNEVDLRTTRGPLRDAIRQARETTVAALSAAEQAIKADIPA